MNDDRHSHDDPAATEDQRLARDVVRVLPRPKPDPRFRASVRALFVAAASPVARRHRLRIRWAVPVALAATLLLAVGLANRGPAWSVVGTGGEYVTIDGERIPCDDLSPLQAAVRPGCRVVVPDGARLEVLGEVLALELNGGVDVTIPSTPGRWFFRDVSSRVVGDGTLRVATGDGFAGARYRIDAGATELVVTGTAFSVMGSADVVCVCVLEGGIEAVLPDGTAREIPSGGRLTVMRDGSGIDEGAMHESERAGLERLKSRLARP